MSFEESVSRLEEIVAELDGDEVALERALALFEEGVEQLRAAASELGRLEARVKTLAEAADGAFTLEDRER